MTVKHYFHTFGCRVNQYETEILRRRLLGPGAAPAAGSGGSPGRSPGHDAVETADFETADVCVVNTCTVTREADKDALRLVRRIARRNPAARLVVTGCLASRSPSEILAAAPAALVVGNDGKEGLPALLGCSAAGGLAGVTGLAGRTRAYLKVQDGCNMSCAYCIIPAVRPRLECKPWEALAAEARGILAGGAREIVLCGVRLGRYLGQDAGGRRVDFVEMLRRLLELPGDFRLRLSSLEVTDLTDRLLALAASSSGRLCPSFHVPLQSGSDEVLRRMGRWYTAAFYARRVEALRRQLPGASLFTDVMAGFPGETPALFRESLAFVEALAFEGLHVFRYSRRPGTPAARLGGEVPGAEVVERAGLMRDLDGGLRRRFAARSIGRVFRVLMESCPAAVPGPWGFPEAEGLTETFLRVRFDKDPGPGFVEARVSASQGPLARAEPLGTL